MLDSSQCPGGALKSNPRDQRTTTNTPSLLLTGSCLSRKSGSYPKRHVLTQETQTHMQKKKKSPTPHNLLKSVFCRKSKKMCRICTFSSGPHMFPAAPIRRGCFPCEQPLALSRLNSYPQVWEQGLTFPSPPGRTPDLHHHGPASVRSGSSSHGCSASSLKCLAKHLAVVYYILMLLYYSRTHTGVSYVCLCSETQSPVSGGCCCLLIPSPYLASMRLLPCEADGMDFPEKLGLPHLWKCPRQVGRGLEQLGLVEGIPVLGRTR